jgi:hypothetical protein
MTTGNCVGFVAVGEGLRMEFRGDKAASGRDGGPF